MSTTAIKNTMELIQRFDEMKKFSSSIRKDNFIRATSNDGFDMFTMFYLMNTYYGNIHDIEPEAIDYIDCSSRMKMSLKTLLSVLSSDAVWTNIFAFNAFACTVNNIEFTVGEIEDLNAEQIVWAIIMTGAIEGAINLPFSHSVMTAIVGWLKIDGWTAPPMPILFDNFCNIFESSDEVSEIENAFSGIGISDMAFTININDIVEPHLKNYMARNKVIAEYIVGKIANLSTCWGEALTKAKR